MPQPQCSTSINLWCPVGSNIHRAVCHLTYRRRTCVETSLTSGCAILFDSCQVRISAAYCLFWLLYFFIVSRLPTMSTPTRQRERERRHARPLRPVHWDRIQELLQLTGLGRHRHSVVCRTTGPQPVPLRVLSRVRSSALSFTLQYPLFSVRSSSRCLRLLPLLLVPSIFPSITCFRRRFLRKTYQSSWPSFVLVCVGFSFFPDSLVWESVLITFVNYCNVGLQRRYMFRCFVNLGVIFRAVTACVSSTCRH